jgi:uncharacterized protein (DUF1330 family)
MVNLVKKPNEWVVTYVINHEQVFKKFGTIELAADFMTDKLGVEDEDIDYALCELEAYSRVRAVFADGRYNHSEED